ELIQTDVFNGTPTPEPTSDQFACTGQPVLGCCGSWEGAMPGTGCERSWLQANDQLSSLICHQPAGRASPHSLCPGRVTHRHELATSARARPGIQPYRLNLLDQAAGP